MNLLERPLVVVCDLHFSHGGQRDTGRDLVRLVERHAGAELLLNGDIFNLSLDPASRDPVESVLAMLAPERELRDALAQHLRGGAPVWLLPGNHDAALARPGLSGPLLGWLGLDERAPFGVLPWFLRRAGVHVEHGHVYDPDNAPSHPLCVPSEATEPLGVALTRRFLAPNRAFDFAHATEITPVAALSRAFRVFGAKTPLMLGRYFREAGHFCRHAGFQPALADELRAGDARLAEIAEATGVPESDLRALLDDRPRPTHESFEKAFFRLYFDRVTSMLAALGLLGLGVATSSGGALGLGALSALYLGRSVKNTNRYAGLPVRRLREAAGRVRELTGASQVIFGHTHVPDTGPGYLNPGSFTYRGGAGRPYAYVERSGETRSELL